MATVQSVGGAPGIDPAGLADLFKTGILIQQYNRKDQLDRKSGNDDLIKTGIASKTMRPAKDGEKSDFKDSSGRGWVYDDASLKEENRQRDEARKTQAWDTINARASAAAQQAANSGQDYWQTYNRMIATMVGHPDGKMSDSELSAIGEQYGPAAETYFNGFQTAAKDNKTTAPTQVTPATHASILPSLAGLFNGPVPGGPRPMPPNNWTFQNPPPMPMGAHGNPTGAIPQGVDPNMQALMSLMAMRGQQGGQMAPGVPPTQQQLGQ